MIHASPRLIVTCFLIQFMICGNVRAGETVHVGLKQTPKRSMDQIEHTLWNALLQDYVNQDGRVDYRAWKADPQSVRRLDLYLSHLSSADRQATASKASRLAFWINAYNAVTVRGILREYPTTSIRNHTAKLWGYNIWKDLKLFVGTNAYSLDQIEHEILRKMSEPRIHFAVVCASVGCPRLLNEAYTADHVDAQLEANANDFFSRRQNFQYDAARQQIRLSSILDWYGDDFGNSKQAILQRISRWLPQRAAAAARQGNSSVSYLDYDWSLNSQ